MAKDYANDKLDHLKPPSRSVGRGRRFVFIGFFLGCIILGSLYIAKPNGRAFFQQLKNALHVTSSPPKLLPPIIKAQENDEEIHFDFYTELPRLQMALSSPAGIKEQATWLKNTPSSSLPLTSHYILQMGVFKNLAAADRMRLSLLLSGFDANIVKIKQGEQIIYQLQQGPYAELTQAKAIQDQLEAKGMNSIVKKES